MMKILSALLFLSSPVFAASFLEKNMYAEHALAQGTGKTLEAAKVDAQKAIPATHAQDPANSPAIHCQGSATFNDLTHSCPDHSNVVYTIALEKT